VAIIYFNQLFHDDKVKRDFYAGNVMGMGLLGGAVGSFVVMPFANSPENGANFFNSMWLAIGLTFFSFLAVTFVLVPPEKHEKEEVTEATPKLAKKIIYVAIIATAIDMGGDEGTRMARGTILSSLFPEWSTASRQNYLMLGMIGVFIIAMVLVQLGKKVTTLPVIAVFASLFTFGTQLALMLEIHDAGVYLAIWHVGKLVGMCSTFAGGFIIQDFAPLALQGYWNGRNEFVNNMVVAGAPLIFASVYDSFGNPRGQEMLVCTSVISFFAFLSYIPLVAMVPKSKPKDEPLKLESVEYYDKMDDMEFAHLPLETQDKVMMQQVNEGKAPRLVSWGKYQEERLMLPALQDVSAQDFKYLSTSMMDLLSDRKKMLEEQENFKKYQDLVPKVDREHAKAEMGAWIADYFDDAGYQNWEQQSRVYKSMLMTAFPPIDPLDDAKPDYSTMPIDQWEDNLTKFLSIMDTHLATEQRRLRPPIGFGTLKALIKRR